VIRRGEYFLPDDFLPVLREFLGEERGGSRKGTGVILSGVLPHPAELLTLLDEHGIRVADDDLLSCSRRLLVPRRTAEEPFEALTESYFSLPSCTTRGAPVTDRIKDLLLKAEHSGAKGVIFDIVKFCEPELFDVPLLVKALRSKGLAILVVESELNQALDGQLATRIEAFVEMMG
jgi:benzoyl-CoA reductase/2-hydroxyglutaryl-CoA dehydratase subunit BcrC/BadD/HgdB